MDQRLSQFINIQPKNVLIFYRNEFQSASSIKIIKIQQLQSVVRFNLKTTNKSSYLVSESKGMIYLNQNYHYINILISQHVALQQCLNDKFKLVIQCQNFPPMESKFKIIIDYKKQTIKTISKDLNRLEVVSKTSGSNNTTTPSILGHPITAVKKSMLKKSHLMQYLGNGQQSQRANIKEQLDQVIKKVDERRMRLEYLQKEIQKNKSRNRFMVYFLIIAIMVCFGLGIVGKKVFRASLDYYQQGQN